MDATEGEERWRYLNDWPMRRFVLLVLAYVVIQVLFSIMRSLPEMAGWSAALGYFLIPFIIFIPGAIILRVGRLHGLNFTRAMLYSLALSVGLVMAFAFFMNLVHYTGIYATPLDEMAVNIAFPTMILALLLIAYRQDVGYIPPMTNKKVNAQLLFTIALSIALITMVVVGTKVAGYYGPRDLIIYAILIVSFLPLVVLYKRFRHFEIIILAMSICLMFHRSLMTNFIMGYDIFTEYTAARVTTQAGFWDMTQWTLAYGSSANTALSIVGLAPILSQLSGIQTIEMFKVVYPLIFAFVPLAIYEMVKNQFNKNSALLAVFIFIGYTAFYNLMIQLMKQSIAELFLIVFLLVLTDKMLTRNWRRGLILSFLVMALISHYAIGYLIIGMLGGLVVLNLLKDAYRTKREMGVNRERFNVFSWTVKSLKNWWRKQRSTEVLTIEILAIAVLAFYLWYSTAGSGMMLGYINHGGETIGQGDRSGITLRSLDALEYLLIDRGTFPNNIEKYLLVAVQALCIIGVYTLWRNKEIRPKNLDEDLLMLGLVASLAIFACYLVPNFSSMFYYGRFFHFLFIFLCGFFMIGLHRLISTVNLDLGKRGRLEAIDFESESYRKVTVAGTLVVVAFILLNTGVIFVPMQHVDENVYVSNFSFDESVSWSTYSDQDVKTAQWFADPIHSGGYFVTADWHRFPIFGGYATGVNNMVYQIGPANTDQFLYLSSWTYDYNYVYPLNTEGDATLSYSSLKDVLKQVDGEYDVVYSSGYNEMIYIPPSTPITNPPGPSIYTYDVAALSYISIGIAIVVALMAISYIKVRYYMKKDY